MALDLVLLRGELVVVRDLLVCGQLALCKDHDPLLLLDEHDFAVAVRLFARVADAQVSERHVGQRQTVAGDRSGHTWRMRAQPSPSGSGERAGARAAPGRASHIARVVDEARNVAARRSVHHDVVVEAEHVAVAALRARRSLSRGGERGPREWPHGLRRAPGSAECASMGARFRTWALPMSLSS